jgi:formylglycine-generating enzyme required for sulfatase activity
MNKATAIKPTNSELCRFMPFMRIFVCRLLVLLPLVLSNAWAGNLQFTNLQNGGMNYAAGTSQVRFDLSWENSWRLNSGPANWDAVWVFVKFRKNGGAWQHASLENSGHVVPAGMTLSLGTSDTTAGLAGFNIFTNPGVGVFLYRSSEGTGNLSLSNVRLNWNWAANGVVQGDVIDVRVFGIEMVYVPQGAFYAGDNATSVASFKQGASDNDPWYVSSESAFSVTNSVGNGSGAGQTGAVYYYVSNGHGGEDASGAVFTVPAAYPKGFGGFYIMKGEISQGQWVAFFNTLDATQKATRDITSATNGGKNTDGLAFRNNVSWSSGDATLPGGGANYRSIAMNYLSWGDLTAYLDWAGLRPMSELEFEKASRGPSTAVSGEYAWGSTSITGATSITNGGTSSERGQAGSNITYNNSGGVQGPTRVGSFGSGGVTSRVATGSSYYGVFDLSGNLWERSITVGNLTGRSFQGTSHGDGNLGTNGDANQSSWPPISATGAGFRGGGWNESASHARLSDRDYAAIVGGTRNDNYGGRGVRSAAP